MRLALFPVACVATATCSGAPPDSPLVGIWSRSEASCAVGFGLRFARDAVLFVTPTEAAPIFDRVRYESALDSYGRLTLTVRFRLDGEGGGALVFQRTPNGALVLTEQRYEDARTGSARALVNPERGSLAAFSRLQPCVATGLKGPIEAL